MDSEASRLRKNKFREIGGEECHKVTFTEKKWKLISACSHKPEVCNIVYLKGASLA